MLIGTGLLAGGEGLGALGFDVGALGLAAGPAVEDTCTQSIVRSDPEGCFAHSMIARFQGTSTFRLSLPPAQHRRNEPGVGFMGW
eukprot:3417554-Rhodomonas_salina.2